MRLLLDSHVLLAIAHGEVVAIGAKIDLLLKTSSNEFFVSVASLWEIAIKYRVGKLKLKMQPGELPGYFVSLGYDLIVVDHHHALEELLVQPDTRDPFDRLLLAQCQVENMRLVTVDRALAHHPLAWQAVR
ncbi:MAG: type II toxin-antitoxin system VapC family toxin [Proteobacteria bacterium]|nr:type II toxin-antitoxin system VapC family toxin [Pseudomonadota bacterium]